MPYSSRSIFVLILGLVLLAMGVYVAMRPLIAPGRPLTNSPWLDMAFAVVFLIRGVMNVQSARRRARLDAAPPSA